MPLDVNNQFSSERTRAKSHEELPGVISRGCAWGDSYSKQRAFFRSSLFLKSEEPVCPHARKAWVAEEG